MNTVSANVPESATPTILVDRNLDGGYAGHINVQRVRSSHLARVAAEQSAYPDLVFLNAEGRSAMVLTQEQARELAGALLSAAERAA